MKRLVMMVLTLTLVALTLPINVHEAAAQPATDDCTSGDGYIRVGDENSPYRLAHGEPRSDRLPADLHYKVYCPDAAVGPYPTLFVYSGYSHDPELQVGGGRATLLAAEGYVVIGVAPRGSSCSTGTYDFGHPDEARDGYDVVEWIAQQPWSNGKVAMISQSYGAITQFPVAALKPPHLVAIAGQHPIADLYRDAAYPGGIFNAALAGSWGPAQLGQSLAFGTGPAIVEDAASGSPDARCAHQSDRRDPALTFAAEPWDGPFYEERLSRAGLQNIDIPVWTVMSWQDGVVGPRGVHMLSQLENVYAYVGSGGHDLGTQKLLLKDRAAFLDYFLKDDCTRDEAADSCVGGQYVAPPVRVLWETDDNRTWRWQSDVAAWPPPDVQPGAFYLSGDGSSNQTGLLEARGPGSDGPDNYLYIPGSGQSRKELVEALFRRHTVANTWSRGPHPGASLTYTTRAFGKDTAMLGSASLDLWLASTAPDTDVQVTLSEVRPKDPSDSGAGYTEVYIQQGWLRASHRKLDEARSTELLPYHTHIKEDEQLLNPLEPAKMRVEILPFGHVFREGSHLRLTIEAPKSIPDTWGFAGLPLLARNTVFHDESHPSKLVLPILSVNPGILPGYPSCASPKGLRGPQPCRDVPAPQHRDAADVATELSFVENSPDRGAYSDQVTAAARLTTSDGTPVEAAPVQFELWNTDVVQRFEGVTNADGIVSATATVAAQPGSYVLVARYEGNYAYRSSSDAMDFVVDKEATAMELSHEDSANKRRLVARLSDHDAPSSGIAGATVSFFVDGEPLADIVTDADGVATFVVPYKYYGRHSFSARFAETDYYLGSAAQTQT
ncbi:MAG: CocE/NonD family hydrolase [Actinomycetota bacterium]|nr:CocE/NonD family hydrolase [Actinomycetota bacterium]